MRAVPAGTGFRTVIIAPPDHFAWPGFGIIERYIIDDMGMTGALLDRRHRAAHQEGWVMTT
ncbi:hypothetical protein CFR78_13120 [Komagataeibacter rhaeticus]|nr:hypothetical protein CT154_00650 [Komagataeibacter xylinus]KDU96519.1 hypothetical protein GLUCORHAEAF1_01465 [Komagataeibacter rhaeticus AF1]PYD52746.1 hypothetical protein CFR78_13120 [Komagataeibacter rhaeticus]